MAKQFGVTYIEAGAAGCYHSPRSELPSSGMRMLTFYVNRAGKNLTKSRLRAKELLQAYREE